MRPLLCQSSHMRLLLAAMLLWTGCLTGVFAQQDADNRYLSIYAQIQQANALHDNGNLTEALTAYVNIQGQLLDFQKTYPDWDTDIVSYRVSDLADKIASLRAQLPPSAAAAPIPAAAPINSTMPSAPAVNGNAMQDASAQLWQQQLQALREDNARLQAKLQEALSYQPATADADALDKANNEIRELMKQNALLEIGHHPPEPGPSQAEYSALQAQLKESEKKRAAQQAAIEKLKSQNHSLQTALDHVSKTNADLMARVNEEDRKLQARLEAMQAELKAAKQEKIDLQEHLKQWTTEVVRTDQRFQSSIYLLTAQRDALAKQLKPASPASAPDQVIEINTTPATDQILTPNQMPALPVMEPQTSPPAIRVAPDPWPEGAAGLAASVQRHFLNHELSLAEVDERKLLQIAPQSTTALANLAVIEFGENQLAAAQKDITAALALSTDDASNLALRGKIEYVRGDNIAALMDLSEAAQLDTNNAGTENDIGLTLNHLGQRDAAEAAFNQAVQIDRHYAVAQDNLARFYLTQNPPNAQLARWHYQRAREAGEPRNPELEKWLAQYGSPADLLSDPAK